VRRECKKGREHKGREGTEFVEEEKKAGDEALALRKKNKISGRNAWGNHPSECAQNCEKDCSKAKEGPQNEIQKKKKSKNNKDEDRGGDQRGNGIPEDNPNKVRPLKKGGQEMRESLLPEEGGNAAGHEGGGEWREGKKKGILLPTSDSGGI